MAGILGIVAPILGGLFSGGGSGGGAGPLASLLGGSMTAQRIPGQTQSGEYSPTDNSLGATYNYIPTGAPQIDPALLNRIFGNDSNNMTTGATAGPLNAYILSQMVNNPTLGTLQNAGNQAGVLAQNGANRSANWNDWYSQLAAGNDMAYRNLGQIFQNNPFIDQTIANGQQTGNALMSAGNNITTQGSQLGSQYQGVANNLLSNPYASAAQGGASTAGSMLTNAGQNAYGQGGAVSSTAMQGLPAASSVLNTAFDPQNALYARTLQQTQDQLGTYLANSGLTNSGSGAKIAGDTLNNFNIDWQNNQLGRQTQGLSAFNSGVGAAGQNAGTGNNLQTQGAQTYYGGASLPYETFQGIGTNQLGALQSLGQGLTTGANLQAGGLGLQQQGTDFASNTYNNAYAPQLQFQNAYSSVGLPGTINATNSMASQGNNAVTNQYGAGQLPFNASQNALGSLNTGLTNYLGGQTSLGNMNNQSVIQMLNYLNQVMTGSNNAANATRGTAANTQNQNAGAAAGAGNLIQGGFNMLGNLFNQGGSGGSGGYASPNNVWNPSFSF